MEKAISNQEHSLQIRQFLDSSERTKAEAMVESSWRHYSPWILVFLLALGLRLGYLHQISGIPFFRTLVGDAAAYDSWGQEIAGGDWLGNSPFYQAPAYPYFLGVIYRVLGHNVYAVRVIQALLGSASCVLIGLAGQRFFNRRAGIVAAIMLAVYPPAIFFDGLIQKSSLGLCLMSLFLWQLSGLRGSSQRWRWMVVGIILGLLGITRENTLLLPIVLLVWLWACFPRFGFRMRLSQTLMLSTGLIITLGPVAWRNYHVGGEIVITTVQAGPNFFIGNNSRATGRYTPLVRGHEAPPFERDDAKRLAEQAVGHSLSDRQVSRYWFRQSLEFIGSDPGGWLLLLAKKALLAVNAYEITDTEGYSVYRLYSPLLNVLAVVFHFGAVFPLALAGILLSWSDWRRFAVLLAVIGVLTASIVAFLCVCSI